MNSRNDSFKKIFLVVFFICVCIVALSYIFYYLFTADLSEEEGVDAITATEIRQEEIRESDIESIIDETAIEKPIEEEINLDIVSNKEDTNEISDTSFQEVKIDTPVDNINTQVSLIEETAITKIKSETVDDESVEIPVDVKVEEIEIRIPDIPILFEPLVEEMFDDDAVMLPPITPVYDDDFFADFFVSGSDSLQIEDGTYYYKVYVDEELLGDIEVIFSDSLMTFSSAELKVYIGNMITDDAYERIFTNCPDFISVDYILERGVEVIQDDEAFTLKFHFSIIDMPERTLSITNFTTGRDRFTLSGATEIQKNFFSWASAYSLYANYDWMVYPEYKYWYLSLNSSNYMNFGNLNLDFYYNIGYKKNDLSFNFNSYRFFYDLIDESIRISFGNVSGFGLGTENNSLGIQFEKNYSYGNKSAKRTTQEQYVEVTEDSRIVVESNGKKIYERTVAPGKYRIKDFTFETGINDITIIVTPLWVINAYTDLNQIEEYSEIYSFSLAYDSQLLSPGDYLYGGSLTIGRETVKNGQYNEGLPLKITPSYGYLYHFDDISFAWYQHFGLTQTISIRTDFAASSRPNRESIATVDFSLVNANKLGTTSFSSSFRLDSTKIVPEIDLSVTHRFIMKGKLVSSLSMALDYSNPIEKDKMNHELSLSVNMGGSLGMIRYTLSSLITTNSSNITDPIWRINGSVSLSPMKNLSISTSISAYQNSTVNNKTQIVGHISATYSFGKTNVSYSSDYFKSNNVSLSTSFGKDSMQVNLSGLRFNDLLNHNLSASYSHVSDRYLLGIRAQANNNYNRFSTSMNLSTALFYTDGLFGISRSIKDSFLLIRPKGTLKKANIEVAKSSGSNAENLKTFLGTGMYSGLTSKGKNNLVVYISGKNEFADTQTYAYELNSTGRGGFSIRAEIPDVFTVTGVIKEKGEIKSDFSSPVYELLTDENGVSKLVQNPDLYLFCDQDGRFIISSIEKGIYFFDYSYENNWYAVCFIVGEEDDEKKRVWTFDDFDAFLLVPFERNEEGEIVGSYDVPQIELLLDYTGYGYLDNGHAVDTQEFWNSLFPSFEEDDFWITEETSVQEEVYNPVVFSAD